MTTTTYIIRTTNTTYKLFRTGEQWFLQTISEPRTLTSVSNLFLVPVEVVFHTPPTEGEYFRFGREYDSTSWPKQLQHEPIIVTSLVEKVDAINS